MDPAFLHDGESFWKLESATEEAIRVSFRSRVIYGMVEWAGSASVDEWALPSGDVVGLRFDSTHDDGYSIVTTVQGDPLEVLRRSRVGQLPFPQSRAQGIDNWKHASANPDSSLMLPVDGVMRSFELWDESENQWAASSIDGLGVVVRAWRSPIESIALSTVRDINPYVQGRRSLISRMRLGSV